MLGLDEERIVTDDATHKPIRRLSRCIIALLRLNSKWEYLEILSRSRLIQKRMVEIFETPTDLHPQDSDHQVDTRYTYSAVLNGFVLILLISLVPNPCTPSTPLLP